MVVPGERGTHAGGFTIGGGGGKGEGPRIVNFMQLRVLNTGITINEHFLRSPVIKSIVYHVSLSTR